MSPAPLALGTWNCRMALARKHQAVRAIGADVLVVPEAAARVPPAGEPDVSHAWKGTWAPKGLGVYAFGGWRVEPVLDRPDLPWVLPVRLRPPGGGEAALLLATWPVLGRRERRPGYTAQLAAVLDAWEDELAAGRTILAGDLNASATATPAGRAHRRNVDRLHELGLRSAYHACVGCAHGEEPAMTLRWIARGGGALHYHCDMVFVPERWLTPDVVVEVGGMDDWVGSGLSDHVPVVVRNLVTAP
jgi:endonuclease/exonuclease/phosphatase family metal-dependent hydrolase